MYNYPKLPFTKANIIEPAVSTSSSLVKLSSQIKILILMVETLSISLSLSVSSATPIFPSIFFSFRQ